MLLSIRQINMIEKNKKKLKAGFKDNILLTGPTFVKC